MSEQPAHIVVEAPVGLYHEAPDALRVLVTPYLTDLTRYIKNSYFTMADNFEVQSVLDDFLEEMHELEDRIAGNNVQLHPNDPLYAKVVEITGHTEGPIFYPAEMDIEGWVAAHGKTTEDE